MQTSRKLAIAAGAIAVIAVAIPAAASSSGDDTDVPITGDALTKATEVALDHTGEGRVTETEVGDEDSYYEVEVRLDDGTELDVQLNEQFEVVGSESDGAGDNDD